MPSLDPSLFDKLKELSLVLLLRRLNQKKLQQNPMKQNRQR